MDLNKKIFRYNETFFVRNFTIPISILIPLLIDYNLLHMDEELRMPILIIAVFHIVPFYIFLFGNFPYCKIEGREFIFYTSWTEEIVDFQDVEYISGKEDNNLNMVITFHLKKKTKFGKRIKVLGRSRLSKNPRSTDTLKKLNEIMASYVEVSD